MRSRLVIALLVGFALTLSACAQDGPKNAVVLIIRHAEDANAGDGLSPGGQQRAEAYKDYFLNFTVDSKRLVPDAIFAAKGSKRSHRPRLTIQPFAKAAKLPIDTRFGNNDAAELAATLRETEQKKIILICWRHGEIPNLLRALGAEPENLLPRGKWPDSVYDWVIVLTFDQDGHIIVGNTRRIKEHLLPGDSQ
jgi:hypothetical protein